MATGRSSTRRYARAAVCGAALIVAGCSPQSTRDGTPSTLTVVSYGGGAWQETHRKSFLEPFRQISGTPYNSEVWDANYGKLKNMVASGKVTWDVVEVTAANFIRGKRDSLFQRLDLELDSTSFVAGAIDPYGIANVYWSTVLAYDSVAYGPHAPHSWRDFWNTKAFPGPRALYDDARANLEFALIADGVARDSLYPLDVDRAFRSLDRIKPFIKLWWTDGSQPIQLLTSHQVVMTSAWNGRLFAARPDAPRLGWTWNEGAVDLAWWTVPRGSHNLATARRFIWFASQPYSLAAQAERVGYGPSNREALRFLEPAISRALPTAPANYAVQFVVSSSWWAEHEQEVQKRWLEWKGKH